MEWPQVLQYLHLMEFTAATHGGQLVVEGDVDRLHPRAAEAITEHRRSLIAILAGGHAWAPCNRCGIGTLTPVRTSGGKRRSKWPGCRMTPGCSGEHTPSSAQVDAMMRAGVPAPPAQADPPAKPERQRHFGEFPAFPAAAATGA